MTNFNSQPVLVSIIMPMYNAERYVFAALTSILREEEISLEVIVVNDGSSDGSLKEVLRIKDARLRVLQNQGKGIAAAMNTGLEAACGSIITRCDADDLYPKERLRSQIEWLQQHEDVGAVCGNYSAIDPKGTAVIQFRCGETAEEITDELLNGNTRTHFCTFAVRTELMKQLGGFRSYFVTGEDVDLQLRLSEISKVWFLPGIFYQYRVHDHSITHTKSSTEREFFDFIAREFQRQRATFGEDDIQRGCPPKPPKRAEKGRLTASQHIQGFLLCRAWEEFKAGQKRQAFVTGIRSAMTLPSNFSVWRSLMSLGFKSVGSVAFPILSGGFVLNRMGIRE